jgi:hypothetical protein
LRSGSIRAPCGKPINAGPLFPAEIGLGDDQRAQAVGPDVQRLGLLLRVGVDQRDAARETRNLAEKLPLRHGGDRIDVAEAIALRDRDAALKHDVHAGPGLARLDDTRATRVAMHVAEAHHPRDVGLREHRKHLVLARSQVVRQLSHRSLSAVSSHSHPPLCPTRTMRVRTPVTSRRRPIWDNRSSPLSSGARHPADACRAATVAFSTARNPR